MINVRVEFMVRISVRAKFRVRSMFSCLISGSGLDMGEKEGQEVLYLRLVS